ncbi:MAG: DUF2157 domain-containing protein [Alphaproteobacteria bacterium]|jgi:uncharacterized membrane protein
MTARQDALQEIISIARLHKLNAQDIAQALADKKEAHVQESGGVLSRLFGYIGGILVFAGICILIGQMWDDMGSYTRVIVTLGTGFSAYLFGLAAIGHEKFDRAATPFLLIAALFQPAGIFVMLDEFSRGGKPEHGILFMAGTMLLQQGLTFWHKRRTTLAFTSIVFGGIFFVTLMDLYEIDPDLIGLCIGTSLMLISWSLSQSPHRSIAAPWYFIGSVAMLVSFGDIIYDTAAEPLFLGLSAFFIFLSTRARSRTLLLVGTLAMLCYIAYFTGKHFKDSLNWAVMLILCGGAFIGLGALALRINAKYIRAEKPAA